MRHRLLCLVLMVVVGATGFGVLWADEPALTRLPLPVDFTDEEAWYGIYINGNKSGWAHERTWRLGSGRAAMWVSRLDAEIRMMVLGQVGHNAIGEMYVFDGTPPYALRRAVSLRDDGVDLKRIQLWSTTAGLRALITEAGETRERRSDAVVYTFEDQQTPFTWVREPREVGDTLHTRGVSVDDIVGEITTYVVTGKSTEVLDGVSTPVYDVAMSTDREGDQGELRLDASGRMLLMSMGGMFELRRETEAVAKETAALGDVFLKGAVDIDVPIGKATKVRRLVIEVQGEEAHRLADAPRQKVVVEGDTVLLHLGDVHPGGFPATPEEIAESLGEETEYPIYDPGVVALAKRAIGDATTDREKVARLVRFVDKYVKDENVATGLSVIQLLHTPVGDCSEHALLMTALARTVGIPSREVSGLMYMGNRHQTFGAHAWSEVVLDGKWVAVDPAWNQLELDATHVTLSRTNRDQMQMLHLFGKISFVLREVEKGS